MQIKDYNLWHKLKTWLNNTKPRGYFHEREIWWCSIGENVGFEQDGKGGKYARPVLVFKKFNNEIFWAIPLTTADKTGKFYSSVVISSIGQRTAILSQLRLIDAKRLMDKIGIISKGDYTKIQKAIINLCGL